MFVDERLKKNDASGCTISGIIQDMFGDVVDEIYYIQCCVVNGNYSNKEIYDKLEDLKKKLW